MNYVGLQLVETDEHLQAISEMVYKDLTKYSLMEPNTTVVMYNLDNHNAMTVKYLGAICSYLGLGLIILGHNSIDLDSFPVQDKDIQVSYSNGKFKQVDTSSEIKSKQLWHSLIADRVFCYGAEMKQQIDNVPEGISCWSRPYPE